MGELIDSAKAINAAYDAVIRPWEWRGNEHDLDLWNAGAKSAADRIRRVASEPLLLRERSEDELRVIERNAEEMRSRLTGGSPVTHAIDRAWVSALFMQAAREPIGVDISDYSDEYCEGFLHGQVNALEALGHQT
jgi:hypothetical protein